MGTKLLTEVLNSNSENLDIRRIEVVENKNNTFTFYFYTQDIVVCCEKILKKFTVKEVNFNLPLEKIKDIKLSNRITYSKNKVKTPDKESLFNLVDIYFLKKLENSFK